MDAQLADWLPLAALLLATGLVAGIVGGLLGVGGGIVIVPVLYHVFRDQGVDASVRMHLAVGTSLGTIVLTAFRSVRSHYKLGVVDTELLRSWGGAVLVGVLLGSVVARCVDGRVLTGVFGAVALVRRRSSSPSAREGWKLRDGMPGGLARQALGARDRLRLGADGARRRHARRADPQRIRRADPPRGRHRGGARADDRSARLRSRSSSSGWGVPGRPPFSAAT